MDRIKTAIALKELDMEVVGRKIVEKHPYRIMMDAKQNGVPATEQTMSTDVPTFSCRQIGKNFQNIPYSLNIRRRYGEVDRYTVSLLNIEGDISEVVEASYFNSSDNPVEFLREREAFKFKASMDTIIVAVILTENEYNGNTDKCIMLLSEPMTIDAMQMKRDEKVFGEKKKAEVERLESIKMLWGKVS